jgi:hypothetical protein
VANQGGTTDQNPSLYEDGFFVFKRIAHSESGGGAAHAKGGARSYSDTGCFARSPGITLTTIHSLRERRPDQDPSGLFGYMHRD